MHIFWGAGEEFHIFSRRGSGFPAGSKGLATACFVVLSADADIDERQAGLGVVEVDFCYLR